VVIVTSCFTLLFTVFGVLFIKSRCKQESIEVCEVYTPSIFYIPFLLVCSILYMRNTDIHNRAVYIHQIQAGLSLQRQERLIGSMLPPDISLAIREGKMERLASYYSSVTILFCYVVDFTKHTSSFSGQVHILSGLLMFAYRD
jgi:hypothetical protein